MISIMMEIKIKNNAITNSDNYINNNTNSNVQYDDNEAKDISNDNNHWYDSNW